MLRHGLSGSGADIEYEILKEFQYGYLLKFFDTDFYISKKAFYNNGILSYDYIKLLRSKLKECI
jgi:hypothetical protein